MTRQPLRLSLPCSLQPARGSRHHLGQRLGQRLTTQIRHSVDRPAPTCAKGVQAAIALPQRRRPLTPLPGKRSKRQVEVPLSLESLSGYWRLASQRLPTARQQPARSPPSLQPVKPTSDSPTPLGPRRLIILKVLVNNIRTLRPAYLGR